MHFGLAFNFTPSPDLSSSRFLHFQQQLLVPARGIEFQQASREQARWTFARQSPQLQVVLALLAPAVGQLTIISAPLAGVGLLSDFVAEAESVIAGYQAEWPAEMQVISRDCTLRYLYAAPGEHAFKYLWEDRLRQGEARLTRFGKPILGGGLRFFMPLTEGDSNEVTVEVKIESLFQDHRRLFVEVQAVWPTAQPRGVMPDPAALTQYVSDYVDGPVMAFIQAEG